MNLLLLAELELKHLVYLVLFVIWILGQFAESQKKKRQQRERAAAERSTPAAPPQQAGTPVDADLKKLLEQLTGVPQQTPQPAPAPSAGRTASPTPPPPLPPDATIEQHRERSRRMKAQLQQKRAAQQRAAAPPPVPQPAYELQTLPSSAAPDPVAPASISVGMKSQNVGLPQMKIAKLRSAPSSPMRATADAQRLAWLKNPQTLRQIMVARMLLDPPKALEGVR